MQEFALPLSLEQKKQVKHKVSLGIPIAHPRSWMYRAFCFMLRFSNSRDNQEQNLKMRQAYREMVKVAAQNGWGDYRVAPTFQDDVMNAYSFNGYILRRFSEQLKDCIDPNGILAPGRGGI